ncbi:uncharacterized protein EI90DRAFT_3146311 [Cantharellus anzutake]|uniref:uncharacterized protein n=1 Tax=Cantharellus anzutake TaxID=1750568 RepID=UPI001902D9C8|nr:uncharacterized protein EI90DRAFT_3146311 [Cantharellus anzutake]KAF8327612.1 hypothetical protein EI90DRAFT_3146311 [Cantharellus anzutake]
MFVVLFSFVLAAVTLSGASSVHGVHQDPCVKIAGHSYVAPADALACMRSFPYNETLKKNVLAVVSGALDFFTFEAEQIHSPPPFQESSVNLRSELARIKATKYPTDYDFNKDLFDTINRLNDGHTLWLPFCYWASFQNIIPAPVVSLSVDGVQNVYIAPDTVAFISQLGALFTSYYDSINFDWKRYAGAKVLEIGGMPAYSYIDHIASTVSGNYLDHGIRVNSVFSGYRIASNSWSQRLGDLAGPFFPTLTSLEFKLIRVNSARVETVKFPYRAAYINSGTFTDSASYWKANCAVTATTNGQSYYPSDAETQQGFVKIEDHDSIVARRVLKMVGAKKEPMDIGRPSGVGLPAPQWPTAPLQAGTGVLKSYILPDKPGVGVMMVGSFEPRGFVQFQQDVIDSLSKFRAAKVTKLIIDVSNNGGGYVCLGEYLHLALVGSSFGYGGFTTSHRANDLARVVVAADIKRGVNASISFYAPDNYAFLNGTPLPKTYNYMEPPVSHQVNGLREPVGQRILDNSCTPFKVALPPKPYFKAENIVIVGNGNCASTCAQFTTVMRERHNVKMVVFGGKPGEPMEYKGMAGNQVLDWPDLNSELLTAGVKTNPQAPPDLIINGDIRINWRTAYSWKDQNTPIAFRSDRAPYRFPYTPDIVHTPQALW